MTKSTTTPKKDKTGRTTFSVAFTKEQTKPAEEAALKKLAGSVNIEGFRPGKAPAEMLKEKVSPDQLLEETIRELLPDTIKKLTGESEIKPIIPPKVEAESRDPLTLKITFVEHPEVTVKGANKIKVEKKETKVDDKDVEKMIDYVLEQHIKTTKISRAAKEGDRITMNFKGEDSEGKEIEGTETTGHQVIIGSKSLIPGFEEELVGLKEKGKKTFSINFPKKYHAEHLQGKPVTFHVTVTNVEEVEKPKLTDAFAQEKLSAPSADEFKKRIRTSMEEQENRINRQQGEGKLMEEIRNATKVELAPELIEEEEREIFENFARQLKEQNLDFTEWMKKADKKPEDIKAEFNKQAIERLTLRMGIQHLVEEKGIELTDSEIDKEVAALLGSLPEKDRKRVQPMYQKGFQGWHQLKWQKRVEKLIDEMLG